MKKISKLIAIISTVLAIISVAVVVIFDLERNNSRNDYETYQLLPNENLDSYFEQGAYKVSGNAQLTVDDIQAMNGGKARILYSDEGYVTFINGRYSDIKVTDHETAVATIQQVAGLLGLNNGSEFFANFVSKDDDGYSYYTFQQRYGELTVEYATLRVIVDPEGNTAGLSCSFTPNIGIEETEDIGPDEALNTLKIYLTKHVGSDFVNSLVFYPEQTHKVAVTYMGTTYSAYAIYCDNPSTTDFEMRYVEYFMTQSGLFIPSGIPVASFGKGNDDVFRNEEYFESLTATNMEFTVVKFNGEHEKIVVPVSYNSNDKKYYLADPSRLIIVGDYNSMINEEKASFITSDDGKTWRNQDLLVYDRYIKAYDYYAALGLKSVDGTGIPIYIGTQMPEDNACYCGIHMGWAVFAASDLNTYSEAMDVVGHEYTHGIMRNSMMVIKNIGHTGAISESMADIMGNLMEQILGLTDEEWICGECSGEVLRSMKDPEKTKNPTSVGGRYYADPENLDKDQGGVHINAGLLNQMAYKLNEAGMTMEEQRSLWLTVIETMTPLSDFPEVLESLLMSIKINGFDSSYGDMLIDAFETANMRLNRKVVESGTNPNMFVEYESGDVDYSFLYPASMKVNYSEGDGVGLFANNVDTIPYLLVNKINNGNINIEKYFKSVDKQVVSSFASVTSSTIRKVEIDEKTLYMTRYQCKSSDGTVVYLERYVEPRDGYSFEYTVASRDAGELNTALYYVIKSTGIAGEDNIKTEDGYKLYIHPDINMNIKLPTSLTTKELTIGYMASNDDAVLLAVKVTADDDGNPINNRDEFLEKTADKGFMASYLGVDSVDFGDGVPVKINGSSFYSYPIEMVTNGQKFTGEFFLADAEGGGCYLVCYGVKEGAKEETSLRNQCEESVKSVNLN